MKFDAKWLVSTRRQAALRTAAPASARESRATSGRWSRTVRQLQERRRAGVSDSMKYKVSANSYSEVAPNTLGASPLPSLAACECRALFCLSSRSPRRTLTARRREQTLTIRLPRSTHPRNASLSASAASNTYRAFATASKTAIHQGQRRLRPDRRPRLLRWRGCQRGNGARWDGVGLHEVPNRYQHSPPRSLSARERVGLWAVPLPKPPWEWRLRGETRPPAIDE